MIPVIFIQGCPDKANIMKQFRKFLPSDLDQKLTRLKLYQMTLTETLPKEYHAWVKLGDVTDGELGLVVTRQTVAGNLRFYGEAIIAAMQEKHGLEIRKIRVRVATMRNNEEPGKSKTKIKSRPVSSPAIEKDKERLRKVVGKL